MVVFGTVDPEGSSGKILKEGAKKSFYSKRGSGKGNLFKSLVPQIKAAFFYPGGGGNGEKTPN